MTYHHHVLIYEKNQSYLGLGNKHSFKNIPRAGAGANLFKKKEHKNLPL